MRESARDRVFWLAVTIFVFAAMTYFLTMLVNSVARLIPERKAAFVVEDRRPAYQGVEPAKKGL